MFDYSMEMFYLLVMIMIDPERVGGYSMQQHKLTQEHWRKHATQLGLMQQQQEFDEKNVFDVAFVELLKQNQTREFPRIGTFIRFSLMKLLTAGKAKNDIAKIAKQDAMIFPILKYLFKFSLMNNSLSYHVTG